MNRSSDAIGIDFGSSNICISVYRDSTFDILSVDTDTTMPTRLAFKGNELFVGNAAKRIEKTATINLFDFRRFLAMDQEKMQKLLYFPFKIPPDPQHGVRSNLVFEIDSKSNKKPDLVPLKRAMGIILSFIKKKVEIELGRPISKVVMTVPISFSILQRQDLVDAAKIANFNVIHLLHEPVAAAISYYVLHPDEQKRFIFFDFGGGKLDIAHVRIDNGNIEALSMIGDANLGGRDIDEELFRHVVDVIKQCHPKLQLQQKHFNQIRNSCIKAKEALTMERSYNLEENIMDEEISITFTRKEFEYICKNVFTRVEKLLGIMSEKIDVKTVTSVVLLGGSTRIPKVQELIKKAFPSLRDFNQTINQVESVARGAAICAASLTGSIRKLNVIDRIKLNGEFFLNSLSNTMIHLNVNEKISEVMLGYFIENGIVNMKIYGDVMNKHYSQSDFNKESQVIQKLFEENEKEMKKGQEKNQLCHLIEDINILIYKFKSICGNAAATQIFEHDINDYMANETLKSYEERVAFKERLESYKKQLKIYIEALGIKINWTSKKVSSKYMVQLSNAVDQLISNRKDIETLCYSYIQCFDHYLNIIERVKKYEKENPNKQAKQMQELKGQCEEYEKLLMDNVFPKDDFKQNIEQAITEIENAPMSYGGWLSRK